jgi:TPR repeat protein
MRILSRARELLDKGNPTDVFVLYEDLARNGNAHAQVTLGWMYFSGNGTSKDKNQALAWFQRAADLGSSEGAFYCGKHAFAGGKYQDGLKWFSQASRGNYGPAFLWLGLSHLRGYGVPVDREKGIQYLERGAETGNYYARRELALQMIRGSCGIAKVPVGLVLLPYWVVIAVAEFLRTGYSERLLA